MEPTSVPFVSGEGGYHTYRVPALARTAAGTLLAFAEARVGEGRAGRDDSGHIETTLKRSTDGGVTWGPLHVVARAGTDTWGNPTPVVLPSGRILLLTCANAGALTETDILRGRAGPRQTRRVFVQQSDDDGVSWSTPREITGQVKRAEWRWYATGPGPGLVTRTGRVVVPANHSVAPAAGSPDHGDEPHHYGGHGLYSDDGGASWTIGFVDDSPDDAVNPNESAVVELADGRLYLNCRNERGRAPGTRADVYSRDGGQTLVTPYRPQPTITTPVVQGALLALPDGRLLYSGPADPVDRAAMAIRVSIDNGVSWGPPRRISHRPAAYSGLALVDHDTVGLLYETGDRDPYERIAFVRLLLARRTAKDPFLWIGCA